MKVTVAILGVLGVLLGGLWLLQGLGLVHVRPILCFANCAPVQGPSPTWTIIGAVVLAAGIFAIRSSRRSRKRG
jgi:hypothetical protein